MTKILITGGAGNVGGALARKLVENPSYFVVIDYASISYTKKARKLGKSKWTLSKKINLVIDSFVSFSYLPLRIISIFGLLFGLLAIVYILIIINIYLIGEIPVEGWSALMLVVLISSSFIMISIGVIGEYLWRTLDEVRKNPNYIVDKELL